MPKFARLAKVWPIDRIYTKQKKANTQFLSVNLYVNTRKIRNHSLLHLLVNVKSVYCTYSYTNKKNPARVNTVTNSLSWTEPTARWKSAFSTSVSTSDTHLNTHFKHLSNFRLQDRSERSSERSLNVFFSIVLPVLHLLQLHFHMDTDLKRRKEIKLMSHCLH